MVAAAFPRLTLSMLFPVRPTMSLLDYGCGPGILTASFASAAREVVGYDIDEKALSEARQHYPGITFTNRLPNRMFDAAVMSYVVHDAGLQAISDVDARLSSAGLLAVVDFDMKDMDYVPFLRRSIGKDEQKELAQNRWRTYAHHTRFGFEDYVPLLQGYETLHLERSDPETSKFFIWFGRKV